jgi:hypothetical protein
MGSPLFVGTTAHLRQPVRGCVEDTADFLVFDGGFKRLNVELMPDDEAPEVALVEGLCPSWRRRRLGGLSRGPPLWESR